MADFDTIGDDDDFWEKISFMVDTTVEPNVWARVMFLTSIMKAVQIGENALAIHLDPSAYQSARDTVVLQMLEPAYEEHFDLGRFEILYMAEEKGINSRRGKAIFEVEPNFGAYLVRGNGLIYRHTFLLTNQFVPREFVTTVNAFVSFSSAIKLRFQ